MFVPTTWHASLALLLLTVACWGSWGLSAKLSKLPFPAFYALFTCAAFCWSAVLGLVLGADVYGPDDGEHGHRSFLLNLSEVGFGPAVWFACLSGLLSNLATILLTLLITLVGLATAFPICIGTGLVSGALLAYVAHRP